MAFESGFALEEPAGDTEQRGGWWRASGEGGVDEGVGFDESAVQIDAERTGRAAGSSAGAGVSQKSSFLTSKSGDYRTRKDTIGQDRSIL